MKATIQKTIFISALLTGLQGAAFAKPIDIETVLSTSKSWNTKTLPSYHSGQPELKVLKFKIAPGAVTPVHIHPVNGAGYIISGELTMFTTTDPHGSFANKSNVKKIKLKAGEAWAETVNTWHYGVNKGKKDVEFIVIFSGHPGTPPTLTLNQ